MTIFRGYLPTLTGRPGCLLSATYRAVLMAIKQEGLALDIRSVTTEKERAERDPAVVYWHKALVDGIASRTVDLADLQQCFLEKPIRSGAGIISQIKDICSKLPSVLTSRLLGQFISCSCGVRTNTMFPMCVPASLTEHRLVEFLEESALTCPLCRKRESVLSSSVPVLIFIANQEGCLRTGKESNRAFTFAGLEYLTIGAIFAVTSNEAPDALSLLTGVVSPLSGEAEMFSADGKVSQHNTEQFRLWLDGVQENIEGLICVGLFLLNKRPADVRHVRKGKQRKKPLQRSNRTDTSTHVQSNAEDSSYTDESDYQYSYSEFSDRHSASFGRELKGSSKEKQKDRQVMSKDGKRNKSMDRSRSSPSETTEGYQVAAVRVNRDNDLYYPSKTSPQRCTCCGPATITALWIMVSVVGGVSLINLILICVIFSQLR